VMLLYLEDLDAAAIGEIMGLSPGAVRVQIHRIKAVLKRRFHGEPS
jgi:RNA polymerase sigma-70 factor (ECF subfamily)